MSETMIQTKRILRSIELLWRTGSQEGTRRESGALPVGADVGARVDGESVLGDSQSEAWMVLEAVR